MGGLAIVLSSVSYFFVYILSIESAKGKQIEIYGNVLLSNEPS